jgi:hypothetical protein
MKVEKSSEVDSLFLNYQGTPKDLRMDGPDILPKNTDEKEDDGAEEKKPDHRRSDSQGKPLPKHQLINQISAPNQETKQREYKPGKRGQPQGHLGMIGDPKHGHVIKGIKIVFRKSPGPLGLLVIHKRDRETDLGN